MGEDLSDINILWCDQVPTELNIKQTMSPAIRKRLVQIGILVLIQAVVLFVSAWKWNWWNAWAYLGEYLAFLAFNAYILLGKHKQLVEERSQIGEGAKGWDKIIGLISGIGSISILILAGLDVRFGWAGSLPLGVQVTAFILLGLSYPPFTWAMVSNRFFSTIVRIQKERGHIVQTGGSYRFIRHPGYASLLGSYITLPFALGSLWACIPMALLVVNLFVRTELEDRTLQKELNGYKEYTSQVRYRLIPGVW
jgi:protein-S-isoprenylcysteine O-methyltransferase Ste14